MFFIYCFSFFCILSQSTHIPRFNRTNSHLPHMSKVNIIVWFHYLVLRIIRSPVLAYQSHSFLVFPNLFFELVNNSELILSVFLLIFFAHIHSVFHLIYVLFIYRVYVQLCHNFFILYFKVLYIVYLVFTTSYLQHSLFLAVIVPAVGISRPLYSCVSCIIFSHIIPCIIAHKI